MAAPEDLETSLTKLSLNPTPSKSSSSFKKAQTQAPRKQQPVSESWEDEELADSSSTDSESERSANPMSPQKSASYPDAPPPTPISPPSYDSAFGSAYDGYYGAGMDGARGSPRPGSRSGARDTRDTARPEKTDAVAKRMIAGALGVRAPNRTEEERRYERAVREKEVKRRNGEREAAVRAREEAERAKVAVWED